MTIHYPMSEYEKTQRKYKASKHLYLETQSFLETINFELCWSYTEEVQ